VVECPDEADLFGTAANSKIPDFFDCLLKRKLPVKKDSFEAAQLTAADLDPVRITVLTDLLFGDAELCSYGECFRAGNAFLDSCTLESLFNLI
jgi:hypothetical protein